MSHAPIMVQYLNNLVQTLDVSFTLNDKPVNIDEVLSEKGLFPAIARRADHLCTLCMGYGLGVTFDRDPNARLEIVAHFDDITPNALRCLFILDILKELIRVSPDPKKIPLDELLYE